MKKLVFIFALLGASAFAGTFTVPDCSDTNGLNGLAEQITAAINSPDAASTINIPGAGCSGSKTWTTQTALNYTYNGKQITFNFNSDGFGLTIYWQPPNNTTTASNNASLFNIKSFGHIAAGTPTICPGATDCPGAIFIGNGTVFQQNSTTTHGQGSFWNPVGVGAALASRGRIRVTGFKLQRTLNGGACPFGFHWIYADTTWGVIDHNTFDDQLACTSQQVQDIQAYDFADFGWTSWSTFTGLDDGNALYIEDNTFLWPATSGATPAITDGAQGGRLVERHNTALNSFFYDGHGMDSSSSLGKQMSIMYFNTYTSNDVGVNLKIGSNRSGQYIMFHELVSSVCPGGTCANLVRTGIGSLIYRPNSSTNDISTWPIADGHNWGVKGSKTPISTYGYMPDPGDWQANHVYAAGACVGPLLNNAYDAIYCTVAGGTSAGSAPGSWPHWTGLSSNWAAVQVTDGTVLWQYENVQNLRAYSVGKTYQSQPVYSANFLPTIQPAVGGNAGNFVFYCSPCVNTPTLAEPVWPQVAGNTVSDSVGNRWINVGVPQQFTTGSIDTLCPYGSGGSCTAFMDQGNLAALGWPVHSQIGRGANQVSSPVLIGDIQCGTAFPGSQCTNGTTPSISNAIYSSNDGNPIWSTFAQQGRDYFVPGSACDGSGVMLQGTLAAIPLAGNCYYYANNDGAQGKIYKITAGVATVYLTPYTYPHPNAAGGTGTITIAGSGGANGTVTGSGDGSTLSCTLTAGVASGSCGPETHNVGAIVTLTASATNFGGFTGGGCSSSPCTVDVGTGTTTVTANFNASITCNLSIAQANVNSGTPINATATFTGLTVPWNWWLTDPNGNVIVFCSNSIGGCVNTGATVSLPYTVSGTYTPVAFSGGVLCSPASQPPLNVNFATGKSAH